MATVAPTEPLVAAQEDRSSSSTPSTIYRISYLTFVKNFVSQRNVTPKPLVTISFTDVETFKTATFAVVKEHLEYEIDYNENGIFATPTPAIPTNPTPPTTPSVTGTSKFSWHGGEQEEPTVERLGSFVRFAISSSSLTLEAIATMNKLRSTAAHCFKFGSQTSIDDQKTVVLNVLKYGAALSSKPIWNDCSSKFLFPVTRDRSDAESNAALEALVNRLQNMFGHMYVLYLIIYLVISLLI